MLDNKTLKGLKVKYDYPATPFKGIRLGREYIVNQSEEGCSINDGSQEIKFDEQELRLFFTVVNTK